MPPVVNPVSDLARIYRQRVPTQTGQPAARSDRFGFGMATRPAGQTSSNPLGGLARAAWGVIASPAATLADIVVPGYEPEKAGSFNILQQGGADLERSTRRAVGDITAIPGIGRPSASPTAAGIRERGWFEGLGQAALDYGNLAATAAPFVAPARAAMLERAAARQTADATEQLARQMAERSAPQVLPDRPIIRMRPNRPIIEMRPTTQYGTAIEGAQGLVVLPDETGLTTLRPVQPSTQRPEWMGATPEQQLSQRDMDLLRTSSLEFATNTPEDYARSLRIMGKRHNPLTTNVDWATTDPARDLDWDKFFASELDAQMYSPEAGQLYAAQAAARNGVMDFLTRNGLMSKFVANAPDYMASRLRSPRDVQRLIQIQMWPELMKQVPELRDYYVNTMRSYGIGF